MTLLHIAALFVALFGAPQSVLAAPYSPLDVGSVTHEHNISFPFLDYDPVTVKRQNSKPSLRILSLGASIVNGVGSTDGNGFRKPLRDALRFDGWDVNMVGSLHAGDMVDWDVEATPGDILDQINERLDNSLGFKPNVVLINGGTNDADEDIAISQAGDRMEAILQKIWKADGMSNTCVILSTLIPSLIPNGIKNRYPINDAYRRLVDQYSQDGKFIVLADMDPAQGPASGWISTVNDMKSDGIHPNDEGHRKMAYVFYKAVNDAFTADKIAPPSSDILIAPPGCDKVYGNGHDAGSLTQRGSGSDDGIYYHDSQAMGTVLSVTSDWDRDQWRFARLYGRERDDLVGWFNKSATEHAFGVWKNNGGGQFLHLAADLNPDLFCNPPGLHFIDMNADGYDDIVCIDPSGNAYLSVNQRDGTASKPPTFKRVSDTALIKQNEGYPQERVRLADIDGDGRGDYCIIDDTGNVHCWRNGWIDDIPKFWEPLGLRFTAKNKGDLDGVRFEDINGDGRDDWMWVDTVGAVETWTNARSCQKGKLGDGLNVAWRQAFHAGQSSGYTHYGMGAYGLGLRQKGRIHFGRIYSNIAAFGELPLQDYIFINHTLLDDDKHKFDFLVWKNIGAGGAKLKADGDKYCNMKGYPDGREDYVWTWSTGKMILYPNIGLKHLQPGESFWGPVEDPIWQPSTNLDRRDLHLVDWDGDGLCDIVWVDPDNNNHVQLWRNKYKETGKWDWDYNANPAPVLQCSQKRGLGIHDLPVRFGDLTGNGRGDYMCIEKDGRVTGFLHNDDGSWTDVGQIKFSQEKDRANLRWADVNGDGKDDMIWVDKFTGDATVWYNRGRGNPAQEAGSSFHWDMTNGPVYSGNVAGTCMYYPDLDGNGRADQHSIEATFTNIAETSFNPSCGLTDRTGDDPEGVVNPNLPVQPDTGNGGGSGGGGGTGGGGVDLPPYYADPSWDELLPVCNGTYDDLDAIGRDGGTIPLNCGPSYVLPVLSGMLMDAAQQYNDILADGYDYYFGIYAEYVRDQAQPQLDGLVQDANKGYFACDTVEKVVCCRSCSVAYPDQNCEYCDNSQCPTDSPWGENSIHINVSEPCPPDYSKRGVYDITLSENSQSMSVYWKLKDDQHDAFFADALDITGGHNDKIQFKRVLIPFDSHTPDRPCVLNYWSDDHCGWLDWWNDYPSLEGFTVSDVINPKDTVSKAVGNTGTLMGDLSAQQWAIISGTYEDSPEDIVDAGTLPVFLVQEAITSMQQVVELGKKIDDENKKMFIVNFLSAVFFIIPFVGEGLAALGLGNLGRVLIWLGNAGDAANGIYGAVDDPSSAPLAILGIVLGAKGLRDSENALKAAELRRSISKAEFDGISPNIGTRMDQVSLVVNKYAKVNICNIK